MVVTLVEDAFEGLYTYRTTAKSTSVRLFTWRNSNNVSVQVISYGATVTSIKVPDKNGSVQEIVMGFNNLKGYEQSNNPYFGSTVGRVANRIGFGKIKFGNSIINVNKNLNNKHQLHGGFIGFDKECFKSKTLRDKVFKAIMVVIQEGSFGKFSVGDKTVPVKSFTWKNKNNVSVQVITYGATITFINVPDKKGSVVSVITGFDSVEGYTGPLNGFYGATVGRVANRLAKGKAKINGQELTFVLNNNGKHHLHGGSKGFDKVLWEPYVNGTKLILSYHSTDGEEGYPGDLVVQTVFELTDDNEFLVDFLASTTKPTFVNLTNHSYFNLAGHDAGAEALYKHVITINADQITEVDGDSIPTGNLTSVANTAFDLRVPKVLREAIPKTPGSNGFDHNFCITKGPEQGNTFVARAVHPDSGRVLEIYSDQPGVQFYTGNGLPEKSSAISGKGKYFKHGAFCLETQKYPDAPNHSNFPSILLNPGEIYKHHVSYKFSLQN